MLNVQANVTGPIDDWARVSLRTVEIGVWELTAGAVSAFSRRDGSRMNWWRGAETAEGSE